LQGWHVAFLAADAKTTQIHGAIKPTTASVPPDIRQNQHSGTRKETEKKSSEYLGHAGRRRLYRAMDLGGFASAARNATCHPCQLATDAYAGTRHPFDAVVRRKIMDTLGSAELTVTMVIGILAATCIKAACRSRLAHGLAHRYRHTVPLLR